MIISRIKLAGIILILFIAGCREKDELTLPVKLHLKIFLSGDNALIKFNGGQIGIKKIQFEGKRDAGGDVFFETDPNIDLPTLEFGKQPAFISDFDIPQGIYNYMKWNIYLKKIKTDEAIVDLDTESLCIGLIINGTFINEDWWWSDDNWTNKSFVLAIDYMEQFSVRSYNSDGNYPIVLSENKDYEADLMIYSGYAFSSLYPELYEILDDSLQQEKIISSSENRNMYDIVLNRIITSSKVIVK